MGRYKQGTIIQLGLFKACSRCGLDKFIADFSKDSTSKIDGLRSYCKDCAKSDWNTYCANPQNMNRLAAKKFIYRQSHKEESRLSWRNYHAQNLEQLRSSRSAYMSEWQRKNPDKANTRNHRRRSRERGASGVHTTAEWLALCEWFGSKCLICGAIERLTRDHVIPLNCGGSNGIDNLQPLCHSCNGSKQDRAIDYRDPNQLQSFLLTLSDGVTNA